MGAHFDDSRIRKNQSLSKLGGEQSREERRLTTLMHFAYAHVSACGHVGQVVMNKRSLAKKEETQNRKTASFSVFDCCFSSHSNRRRIPPPPFCSLRHLTRFKDHSIVFFLDVLIRNYQGLNCAIHFFLPISFPLSLFLPSLSSF